MFKVVIIEDEHINAMLLHDLLQEYFPDTFSEIHFADSLEIAEPLLEKTKPDLVMLDINLPDGQGLDLVPLLLRLESEIIFVTAYDQYALHALNAAAIHYLLKPIDINKLKESIERFLKKKREHNEPKQNNSNLDDMLKLYLGSTQKMAVATKSEIVFVEHRNLLYLIADGAYTHFYLLNAPSFIASKPIGFFEKYLPPLSFIRVHDSAIINIIHLSKYHRGRGGIVEMSDGKKITVSVRRKTTLVDSLSKLYDIDNL